MPNPRVLLLFSLFWLSFPLPGLQADLKPDEVPSFQLRARVASVGGEKPDGRKFSFRFGVGGKQAATVQVPVEIQKVESVRHGPLDFRQTEDHIELTVPLDAAILLLKR